MNNNLSIREAELRSELRFELTQIEPDVLPAMARAIERDGECLIGGRWGGDDGDGCLLTLAAHALGLETGEQLLRDSISTVRIPALFDELWWSIVTRSGDQRLARKIIHRLITEALALRALQGAASTGSPTTTGFDSERSARAR
ncbi:MAG: hypothetical protein EXQ67_02765 [Thermoleophilia bacterium]|nr:hypothetical protein [Thermoleophilia bacterium]